MAAVKLFFAGIWSKASRYLMPILAGLGAVIALVTAHKVEVFRASRKAVKGERKEAEQAAHSRRAEVANSVERDRSRQRDESARRNEQEAGRDAMDNDW